MQLHKNPVFSDRAASETIGAVMLISVVVMAVAIIGVALTSQGTPQQIPALDAVISNYGNQIQIYHNGGDTLQYNEIEILVDGTLQTDAFKKGGAAWTSWSPGESLVAVFSSPKLVRIVYKGPSGSRATLASADFSPSGMNNPGPILTDTLHAVFSSSPSSGAPPLVVQFSDGSTGYPVGWNWDFGDGGNSNRQNPTHVFGSSGTYTVSLTISNATGSTSSTTHPIIVSTNPPSPSGISPGQGTQGSSVPISVYGTGFVNGATIKLKRSGSTDISATSVAFVSTTTLTGTISIPAGASVGLWDVVVTNPDSQIGTLSNGFTVTTTSGPIVSAILPSNSLRTTSLAVTVAGSGFTSPITSLTLKRAGSPDITATNVIVVSSNMVTGNFDIATATYGSWDVVVTNTDGHSGTLASGFTVNAPLPTVTSILPTSGPLDGGTAVTITGTNLTDATAVAFGTTAATSFSVTDDTHITAISPLSSAGVVDVKVTSAGGTSAVIAGDQFTYVPVPTVTLVSPDTGTSNGATVVAITGTGFTSTSTVKFGSIAATSVTYNSDISLTATSPPGSAGIVDVTVTTTGGTSQYSSLDQFDYYTIQTFTSPGGTSIAPTTATKADYLVVAGGGGGGRNGGGGGAGGVLTGTLTGLSSSYTVTVGNGGAGSSSANTRGANGGNSIFASFTAIGGGGGGSNYASYYTGAIGGSGGGGTRSALGGTGSQGYAGGVGNSNGTAYFGGGGGGAGATGSAALVYAGGRGGTGIASSLSGSSVTYACGGGGGAPSGTGRTAGGAGCTGAGAGGLSAAGSPATGFGSGGGGSGTTGTNGGAGYAGIVIIKYY
jgi:PKD repeat protein